MGLNEAAGYGAVALTAIAAGYLAAHHGLRPAPFLLGISYTALALGLVDAGRSSETRGPRPGGGHRPRLPRRRDHDHLHAKLTNRRCSSRPASASPRCPRPARRGWSTTSTSACPGACSHSCSPPPGLPVGRIGVLFALYPAVWGVGQLVTGALSDRWGRKHLITAGMFTQATALALIATADTFVPWAAGTVLLGAGTAMVYPTLLAAIGDVAHPAWRARAVGVYRLWRDRGYAVGALLGGVVADLWACAPRSGRPRPSPSAPAPRRVQDVRDPPPPHQHRHRRTVTRGSRPWVTAPPRTPCTPSSPP